MNGPLEKHSGSWGKVAAWLILCALPISADSVDFGADYLLEIASDLSDPSTNSTNFFGLGQFSAQHAFTNRYGESTIKASAFWLLGESLNNAVGDINGLSNIAGLETIRLAHLWFQHQTELFRFKIGRLDIDDDFMAFESGADLLHSSFGAFANVTANMPVPTYPVPGLAGLFSYRWNSNTYVDIAVMDGDAGIESQQDNLGFDLGSSGVGGVFVLTQFNHMLNVARDGTKLLFGIGLHSGDFNNFYGQRNSGNGLIYGGMEKQLWSRDQETLTAAIRLAASPFEDRNAVTYQADLTATYRGAFSINNGMISLGIAYLDLSAEFSSAENSATSEWTAELNYRYDFSARWFAISSLQYIRGGTVTSNSKFVGLFRFGWSY